MLQGADGRYEGVRAAAEVANARIGAHEAGHELGKWAEFVGKRSTLEELRGPPGLVFFWGGCQY